MEREGQRASQVQQRQRARRRIPRIKDYQRRPAAPCVVHERDHVAVILLESRHRTLLLPAAAIVTLATERSQAAICGGSVGSMGRLFPGDMQRLAHEAAVRRTPLRGLSVANVELDDTLIWEMADGRAAGC